jgi:hypothetical protein
MEAFPKYVINTGNGAEEAQLPFAPCQCKSACYATQDANGHSVWVYDQSGDNWLAVPYQEVPAAFKSVVIQKCDCGAAAADYSISRDGGPGHSDWCQVTGR